MKKSLLKYEPRTYYPEISKLVLSDKEMEDEYRRLRSVVLRRLNRLKNTEFKTYADRQKKKFPAPKNLDKQELRFRLFEIKKAIGSVPTGYKQAMERQEKSVETFRRHGYKFVTKDNIQKFGVYMQMAKAKSIEKLFDSERAYILFEDMQMENETTTPEEMAREYEKWEESTYN